MRISNVPFMAIDWDSVLAAEHPGESGKAVWRTVETGNIRVRLVEYSPGYQADHWCHRGHVIFVLEGELLTELQDGRQVRLAAGQAYCVSDDADPHRSRTAAGAKLFIVD